MKQRNKVAHGRWLGGYGGRNKSEIIYVNLLKDGIEQDKDEAMTVEQLRYAASEITLIVRDLMEFENLYSPKVAPPPPHPKFSQPKPRR